MKIIQLSLSAKSDDLVTVHITGVESKQTNTFVCPVDCLGAVVTANLKSRL